MNRLKIQKSKDGDFEELVGIVEAVESCTFVDPTSLEDETEDIVTVAPPKNPRLKKPNSKLSGWIKSKKAQDTFDLQLEKYQHNQYCYLQRLETGKTSKEQTQRNLTDLEMWFVQIIEPPPKKTRKKTLNYEKYLEEWLKRERVKYQFSRSYYCEAEALKHLNRKRLDTIQSTIFGYYQEVKEYYNKQKM